MNRRALLAAAAASTVAASHALAQPMPIIGPVGGQRQGGGPLFGLGTGPPGATLDLSFMTPGVLDPRITFTRASTATYFDVTGTMQTAPMNIALNNTNLTVAPWSLLGITSAAPTVVANAAVAPDGTTTATRVNYPNTAGGGVSSINNNLTVTTAVYTWSIWAKGVVGGERIWLSSTPDGVSYNRTVMPLTTSWQRFTLTPPAFTGTSWVWIIGVDQRDTSVQTAQPAQSVYLWGAQVELGSSATTTIITGAVPNGAPRWDYDPVTHALRGLLIEEARTNLLLNSAALGTQSVTTTAVATTLSFYGTGSITYSGTASGTLVGAGAFPLRASVTFTPTAGTLTLTVTGSVLNAQVEAGSFVTSWVPTTAAAVTRAVDVATIPLAAWFNLSSGTYYGECSAINFPGRILQASDAGAANTDIMFVTGPTVTASGNTTAASANQGRIDSGPAIVPLQVVKAAYAVSPTQRAICGNAGAVVTSGTAARPSAMPTLHIGCDNTNTSQVNGWMRRVRYWPRALSNAEMQQVTT